MAQTEPTAGGAVPRGSARTLAEVYRHFGQVDAAGTSPLYERVAVVLSECHEALRVIEAAPARQRHPTVILAALHDVALAGRAPALAAAYADADGDAAAAAAIGTLLGMAEEVLALVGRHRLRTIDTQRCATDPHSGPCPRSWRASASTPTRSTRPPRLWPQHHRPRRVRALDSAR